MNILPRMRQSDLVIKEFENEILIYDLILNKAFALNQTSMIVYRACDGKTSFDELKGQHDLTDEIIFLALDQLQKLNLIAENQLYTSPFQGMKRREVIKRIGLSSMIMLPLISSIIAPNAVNAASGAPAALGASCSGGQACTSGTCKPCFGCISPGVNTPTCCNNTNSGARGPGLDPSVGSCINESNCHIAAAQQCCKGTATFTQTGCSGVPTAGTCLCD